MLRPIASAYRCRIASTNGQCGGFLRTDIAPTLTLTPDDVVLYFGDLDLSGGQIEDNTRRVLEQVIGGTLRWERVALTEQQVSDYDLPRITKRDRRYADGRPHEAVETEALRQTVLMHILRDRLDDLRGAPAPSHREQAPMTILGISGLNLGLDVHNFFWCIGYGNGVQRHRLSSEKL